MRPLPLSRRAPVLAALLLAAGACATAAPSAGPAAAGGEPRTRLEDVRAELFALSADSMQGRFTGSEGMWRAARYLSAQLRALGVEPAGDDGYYQRMPIVWTSRQGHRMPRLLQAWADTVPLPAADRGVAVNVVGVIRGSDPTLRGRTVLVDAHYDHLGTSTEGVCEAADGDTICNGADDDASGVVAVLEIARELARSRPKRTVIVALTTGEEVGLVGTRWFIQHPPMPLDSMAANLEIEMIGRPDPMVGGAGKAWLTGYERSTMGDELAAAGVPIVADPRPDQQFFMRSDNIAFAQRGIVAHTLSTFNLHTDYHTPHDEADRVDYAHMTAVVRSAVRAARLLADGPAPAWKPGGQPQPGR